MSECIQFCILIYFEAIKCAVDLQKKLCGEESSREFHFLLSHYVNITPFVFRHDKREVLVKSEFNIVYTRSSLRLIRMLTHYLRVPFVRNIHIFMTVLYFTCDGVCTPCHCLRLCSNLHVRGLFGNY